MATPLTGILEKQRELLLLISEGNTMQRSFTDKINSYQLQGKVKKVVAEMRNPTAHERYRAEVTRRVGSLANFIKTIPRIRVTLEPKDESK